MRKLQLVLALVIMVPAWGLLGGFASLDSGASPWVCLTAGLGVFFGLVFGGNPAWRICDPIFGPAVGEHGDGQ